MKSALLAMIALLALALPADAAFVSTVTSSLPGLSTSCNQSSATGLIVASCSGGGFASVAITAAAPPLLPVPDISATTLTVTSAAAVTLHASFKSSGFSFPGGPIEALLTVNNLVGGDIGPFVLSETTAFGTNAHTFNGPGTFNIGPVLAGAFTFDQIDFTLPFSKAGQSVDATIEIINVVPEPTSIALLGVGMLGLGLLMRRRQSSFDAV